MENVNVIAVCDVIQIILWSVLGVLILGGIVASIYDHISDGAHFEFEDSRLETFSPESIRKVLLEEKRREARRARREKRREQWAINSLKKM